MIKKILMLVTLTVMGASLDANAISLKFKFKVFSSGPNIYACNAGIRHQATSKQVCYLEGTTESCSKSSCNGDPECESRCVCSGKNGGEYLMDYMKVTTADWKDNGDTSPDSSVEHVTKKAGNGTFNAAFSSGQDAYAKRIKNLSFNLGSELYGAEYFVDICYRGPQIEYWADNVAANFTLDAQASATDFFQNAPGNGTNDDSGLTIPGTVDGKKYTELSNLKVSAYYTCDLQGEGTYKFAHNGGSINSGLYNTTDTEALFENANKLPTGGGDEFDSNDTGSLVSASALELFSATLPGASQGKSPRFCKVRYVFSETDVSLAKPNLRKWQRHGAEVCTYTKIEEPAL